MRSPVLKINSKGTIRPKIRKRKKHKHSKAYKIGLTGSNISREKIENINEVLRVHKTHGKYLFKVVPKDSCEVYKARLKRRSETVNDRNKQGNEQSGEHKEKAKNKTKSRNRETRTRRRRPQRRRKKWQMSDEECLSESDVGSCSCCRSMSYSSASDSEMDYD